MKRTKLLLLLLLSGAGLFLAFVAALFLLAPRLVNTTAIKERALSRLERATGVRLSYAHAEVTFFPHPRVVVLGVALDVPGMVQGTIPTLSAAPDLFPLLRGEVHLGDVVLESPDFRVRLQALEKPEKPSSLEEVEKSLSSLLEGLRKRVPGTTVTVRNGRLELSDADGPIVSLRDLTARVALSRDRLTVDLRCASPYWEDLTIETSLRPEGLRSETRIEAAGFRLRAFLERLAPGAAPWLGETVVSLRGRIGAEGLRSMTAEIAGAAPTLTILQGSRRRVLKVKTARGTIDLREKSVRAALSELVLDEPAVRISGDLTVDRLSPRFEVSLTGKELEIAPVRKALLDIAGDVPTVQDILDVVRGGTITQFSLQSAARSPGGLGDAGSLRLRATLAGGSIHIPGDAPLDLTEVGAEVTIAGGILGGSGIVARLGNARATGGSLRMGITGDDPPFHAEFQADAEMGELQPLLRRLVQDDDFRGELDRIREIQGEASGQVVLGERLSSVGVRVTASKIRIAGTYDRIPFPLAVDGGQVSYDGASIAVTGLRGTVGDSSFSDMKGSLELGGSRQGIDRFAASFDGGIWPETAKWAYDRLELPEPFAVQAPYTVTGSEISWERGGAVRAKAALALHEGATLSFSAIASPGRTTIDPLIVHGPGSDARLAIRIDPDTIDVKFAGTLSRETVEEILPIQTLPGHRIEGDLEAIVDRANPARSSVRGTLAAAGVKIPWKPLESLSIQGVSLTADGRSVRVLSSDLVWDNVPFSVTGTANFAGEEVSVDLDISAGDIDAEKLHASLERATSAGSPGPPVRGTLRIAADSVAFQRRTWRPMRAVAILEPEAVHLSITEANICGISTLGSGTLGAGESSIFLVTSTSGKDIHRTIRCLTREKVAITGEFRLSYRLAGKGTGDAFLRSLEGPIEMDLKNGRIREMTLLSRIFSVLNVEELLRGRFPDFGKEGFPYKTLSIRGEAKGGKFILKESALDAPSMQIFATGEVDLLSRESDLKVLVAPFRTVDAIVKRLPVLGYILGGTLVSIPVSVTGDISDPRILPLAPGAIGSGILGIVERTLKLPIKIFRFLFPASKESGAP